jgi:diguanylate cyclase (GGDEF)-like protein
VSRSRRATLAIAFWAVVAALAAGLFVWALPAAVAFARNAPAGFWSLAALALVVDAPVSGLHRRGRPVRPTLSACFVLAIFLLDGAQPAIVVQGLAAAIGALGLRLSFTRGVFLAARLICALAAVEVVTFAAHWTPNIQAGGGLGDGRALEFVLVALVWFAASFGLLAVGASLGLARARSTGESVRSDIFVTTITVMLVTPLLTTMTGWWRAVVALPLLAWNQLSQQYAQHEEQAQREPVSGLLNRTGIVATMATFTAGDTMARSAPRPFGVALVNVEGVLGLEHRLGRDIFEKVFNVAAARLEQVYGSDRVGRLTGEGFAILLPDLAEQQALSEAQRAGHVLQPTVEVEAIPFDLDPAVGLALSPQHGRDYNTLVGHAASAMAQARQAGEVARVYVPEAAVDGLHRLSLLTELHATLNDPGRLSEISMVYQPQVEVATRRVVGVEALLRWTHPEWGLVNTQELITAIEPSAVMRQLTRHVLATVIAQMRDWNAQDLPIRAAVNVSVRDLHDVDFIPHLRALLRTHGVPTHQLTVEITEGMLAANTGQIIRAAVNLADLGVGLSLDDFGTGYASLRQLRQLPLTEVKLDRSYVSRIVSDPSQHAIVLSVHQLARTMDLDVVAEGVEDAATAQMLAALPATIAQGWYYARPMPPDELVSWRRHHDVAPPRNGAESTQSSGSARPTNSRPANELRGGPA